MKKMSRTNALLFCLLTCILPMHAQWVQTTGASGTSVYCFAESGSNLWAGTTTGAYHSTNYGASWSAVTTLPNAIILSITTLGTNVFAGTIADGVYRSADSGKTWTAVNSGLTNTNIYALAVSGGTLFVGTKSGVSYSTTNGASWIATKQVVYVNAFAVSGATIIAACNGSISYTSNYDAVWNPMNNGFSGYVNHFAVSGNDLFSATPTGVWRTKIDAPGWTLVGTGLSNTVVNGVAVSGTKIFAGTSTGMFITTGDKASWTVANTGLPAIPVERFLVSGAYLFAGTLGAGIWRRPLAELTTSVAGQSTALPMQFKLHQNYPNPFNPSTAISFSLPARSFVSLKVFDVIGREVTTLASEEMNAGTHQLQWNAANMPSGVYFYRLQAGAFTETKKLLLIR